MVKFFTEVGQELLKTLLKILSEKISKVEGYNLYRVLNITHKLGDLSLRKENKIIKSFQKLGILGDKVTHYFPLIKSGDKTFMVEEVKSSDLGSYSACVQICHKGNRSFHRLEQV